MNIYIYIINIIINIINSQLIGFYNYVNFINMFYVKMLKNYLRITKV